jgi:hypothetical protein
MEQQLEEIRRRLECAERELQKMRTRSRRLRWLTVLGLAGGVGFMATRSTATKVQAAQLASVLAGERITAPFTIVDESGRAILQVGNTALGRGMLLYDASGKVVCGVGLTSQGRGLAVFDAQEKMIAGLGEGRSQDDVATGRGLTVFDPTEKIVGTVGMGANGQNHGRGVSVNDESGKQVIGLGVWPQRPDRGQLVISHRDGTVLFAQPKLP